jgi:hypothetical protein
MLITGRRGKSARIRETAQAFRFFAVVKKVLGSRVVSVVNSMVAQKEVIPDGTKEIIGDYA